MDARCLPSSPNPSRQSYLYCPTSTQRTWQRDTFLIMTSVMFVLHSALPDSRDTTQPAEAHRLMTSSIIGCCKVNQGLFVTATSSELVLVLQQTRHLKARCQNSNHRNSRCSLSDSNLSVGNYSHSSRSSFSSSAIEPSCADRQPHPDRICSDCWGQVSLTVNQLARLMLLST